MNSKYSRLSATKVDLCSMEQPQIGTPMLKKWDSKTFHLFRTKFWESLFLQMLKNYSCSDMR